MKKISNYSSMFEMCYNCSVAFKILLCNITEEMYLRPDILFRSGNMIRSLWKYQLGPIIITRPLLVYLKSYLKEYPYFQVHVNISVQLFILNYECLFASYELFYTDSMVMSPNTDSNPFFAHSCCNLICVLFIVYCVLCMFIVCTNVPQKIPRRWKPTWQ